MFVIAALAGLVLTLGSAAAAGAQRTAPARLWVECESFSICATEDAGRHWRVVFRVPRPLRGRRAWGRGIVDFLRWSRTAGVVSIDLSRPLSDRHAELWTRDGGRHWWRTNVFDVGLGNVCTAARRYFTCIRRVDFSRGRGSLLFGVEGQLVRPRGGGPPELDSFSRTYRLHGWVPLAPLTCRGRWLGQSGRQLCWGPPANDRLRASRR